VPFLRGSGAEGGEAMTAKDRAAWLATLKIGDRVAVNVGSFTPVWHFLRIERFTKLHVVLTGGDKYRRADGGIVGSNRYSRIEPVTRELLDAEWDRRRRHEALIVVEAARWREVSTETLEAVAALLKGES
jgi:hypothetical protein